MDLTDWQSCKPSTVVAYGELRDKISTGCRNAKGKPDYMRQILWLDRLQRDWPEVHNEWIKNYGS